MVVALIAPGCARLPPSPYALAFTADSRAPRLLQTSQEITVPLTIVNTGQRAWDPARIHVAYHWLWFIPRELARRSRTVPYHDGIRTDLGAAGEAIAPGARVPLQGRVLAPSTPGLYWLQWDMVEEGVTWFAQVSPRQPRSLVVVVPPPAFLLAPLPLLIAIWGVLVAGRMRVRRRAPLTPSTRAFGRTADVLWCASALLTKPLILVHEALLEPTAVAYWLLLVAAVVPPVLAMVFLPRRLRAWTVVGIGIFGSTLILGDVVYYRFFGDLLSAPALLGAHQTGHVWASIRTLVTPGLLWLIVDWPFAIWLGSRLSRLPDPGPSLAHRLISAALTCAVLAAAGISLSAPRVPGSAPLDQIFRDRAVAEQLGPFLYHAYDGWNYVRATWLRPPATDAQIQDALSWFVERAPARRGSADFGAARGKNLIVVQVESLQDFAVDFDVDGQEVMPFLRRWTGESLRFTNVTDETSEGRTSDAEFTSMTSLLPLDHGAVAFRHPSNHYVALPTLLTERGYGTLSAVAFEAGFWNRRVMHPSYGFENTLFEPDFQMTEQIGWGLNDRDFLQQMVPRLEQLKRPFGAWLITLSLHHPFEDFPAAHKELRLGALEGSSFGNYLHTMHFFDRALEDFRESLVQDGLLEDSVLVVFGDHDAGFARDAALARAMGLGGDEADWTLNDRVPLFIRVPHAAAVAAVAGPQRRPAGQADFAPTLLALLGVDPAPLPFVGRNLLGAPDQAPVPRPYGDWLDEKHLFLAHGSQAICYDLEVRAPVPTSNCAGADARARRAREVSRLVIADDLQQRLRVLLPAALNGGEGSAR